MIGRKRFPSVCICVRRCIAVSEINQGLSVFGFFGGIMMRTRPPVGAVVVFGPVRGAARAVITLFSVS
jgi:hypothetical protein